MAAYLNTAFSGLRRAAVAVLIFTSATAFAQALRDPTRPPDAVVKPVAAADAEGEVLQSILVSPRRREAMISGRVVKQGDMVGDAQVIAIRDSEVVLRDGNTQRVLRLYPQVQKNAVAATAASKTNNK